MRLAGRIRKITNKKRDEKKNEWEIINYITKIAVLRAKRGKSSLSYNRELEPKIDWEYIKLYFYEEGFGVKLDDNTLFLTW